MTKRCIVAACLVIDKGKLLLLNHSKIGAWLPPGGHVEEGEFPDEAARRETKEETGLDVELLYDDPIKHKDVAAHTIGTPFTIVYEDIQYKTGSHHIHFDLVYIARVKGGSISAKKESDEARWFTADEIKELDTLPDARSIALKALAMYGSSL
ncbi:MAG: NUDIX domain-containing protein [Candidatus Marsarchaeota archaeon]|jgi:8-oxo-dGTP pyrophosphatase MutT (NUDIX family)|nr:NUDIX domain-containing protein [Candidatus Marsarchaeota archaeon]MCL5111356.1 NUDIX domain-containing protein [Candidatus Marsarchaeota archaeon]